MMVFVIVDVVYTCMCVDKYVIVQIIRQVNNVQYMIQYYIYRL